MLSSIRNKAIILLFLFSFVSLLSSRLIIFPRVWSAFQEVRIRDLESVGDKQAEFISAWMKERKADVAATAREYLVRSFLRFNQGDKEFQELTSYLQFVRDNCGYSEVSLADDQGQIRASTRKDFLGLSIAGFDYFGEALKGNVFVTNVHPSIFPIENESGEMEKGVPTLFISAPIVDDRDKIVGVVSLRVDVMTFSREMCRVKLGETGETYLVDENGYMITESRFVSTIKEMGLIKRRTALELKLVDPGTGQFTRGVQACLKGQTGYDAEGYPDYRGVKVLGFWHWIPEYRWGLMSEIDVDEAYSNLYELDKALFFISLALTLVVVGAAVFLGQKVTAPILHLTEVTRKMSSGDLHQRAVISSSDEIGVLAQSFNTMAETIENNMETIKNNMKEMQQIHSQRMTTIGTLANGIAHYLNNPLSGVNMGTDFLLRKIEEAKEVPIYKDLKEHLTKIKESSKRCETVMEGLLSISRISNPERSPIITNKLMEHVSREVANRLELLKIQLVKEYSPAPTQILGNHGQLRTVFLNLVSNAIDDMPEGGTLTLKTVHLNGEDKVEITIGDTGMGIDKKDLPHLFDPYFILKIRPTARGTGLELALAQLTVQSHGGTIETDSEAGRGKTFKVKFPVHKETTQEKV
jgi:signal transduction histidine kinase